MSCGAARRHAAARPRGGRRYRPGSAPPGPPPWLECCTRARPLRSSCPRVYVYLMRVHLVSDVHGTADALAGAADGADMLICLGDMLLFLDYADHTQGIFADLYGAEHARRYIEL